MSRHAAIARRMTIASSTSAGIDRPTPEMNGGCNNERQDVRYGAAFWSPPQRRAVLDGGSDSTEDGVDVRAKQRDCANDDNSDEAGEQAVLQSGHALLVGHHAFRQSASVCKHV